MNDLKSLREKRGYTAKEASQKLDITENYLFMLEGGIRTPGLKLARKIAELYDITVDDVVDIFFADEPNDVLGKTDTA